MAQAIEEGEQRAKQDSATGLLNRRLCAQCQGWNKATELRGTYATVSLLELAFKAQCLMCTAVSSKIRQYLETSSFLTGVRMCDIRVTESGPFRMPGGDSLDIRVDHSDPASKTVFAVLWWSVEVTTSAAHSTEITSTSSSQFILQLQASLIYDREEPSQLLAIESWKSPYDVNLLKSWLGGCDLLHGMSCREYEKKGPSITEYLSANLRHVFKLTSKRSRARLPIGFRVIDVHRMCIVKSANTISYFALSYMWYVLPIQPMQVETPEYF